MLCHKITFIIKKQLSRPYESTILMRYGTCGEDIRGMQCQLNKFVCTENSNINVCPKLPFIRLLRHIWIKTVMLF